MDDITKIFPTALGLDEDLGNVGWTLDSIDKNFSGSIEFSEYYADMHKKQYETGHLTPTSTTLESDSNIKEVHACSSQIDIVHYETDEDENNDTLTSTSGKPLINTIFKKYSSVDNNSSNTQGCETPKIMSPYDSNIMVLTNTLNPSCSSCEGYSLNHVENSKRVQSGNWKTEGEDDKTLNNILKDFHSPDKDIPSVNVKTLSSDKWTISKEKFLDFKAISIDKPEPVDLEKNINNGAIKKMEKGSDISFLKPYSGAVVIKECYIEPPRISRVSKSFHGKSPTSGSYLNIVSAPRRASEDVLQTSRNVASTMKHDFDVKSKGSDERCKNRPQFVTQLSQPCGSSLKTAVWQPRKTSLTEGAAKNPRFTTTRVKEEEHAASVKTVKKSAEDDQGTPTEFLPDECISAVFKEDSKQWNN